MPFLCRDRTANAVASGELGTGDTRNRRSLSESPIGKPVAYTVVDLDPLMPGYLRGFSSVASGINGKGQVVGRFFTEQGEHAFLYDAGVVRDLGTLGGHVSGALGINDGANIVGYSLTGEVDDGLAQSLFVGDGSALRDLGIGWSSAQAINNLRQIVGEMRVQPNVDLNHAFLYEDGHAIDLGSLPPLNDRARSVALSINERGQIVGESDTFITGIRNPAIRHPAVHAFLYDGGLMRDLGTLGILFPLLYRR